jgi:hypothetical protein
MTPAIQAFAGAALTEVKRVLLDLRRRARVALAQAPGDLDLT